MQPQLKIGIPEINVPAMEPLHIKNIALNTGSGGVHIGASLMNILVWNTATFNVLNMKYKMKSFKIYLTKIM